MRGQLLYASFEVPSRRGKRCKCHDLVRTRAGLCPCHRLAWRCGGSEGWLDRLLAARPTKASQVHRVEDLTTCASLPECAVIGGYDGPIGAGGEDPSSTDGRRHLGSSRRRPLRRVGVPVMVIASAMAGRVLLPRARSVQFHEATAPLRSFQ